MARKKSNRTRVKSVRQDYRTGGRVQYAVGRPVQGESKKKPAPKPMQPVRKPIAQEPQKPVQPGNLTTGGLGGNLKTGTGNLTTGGLGGNLKTGTPSTPRDLPTGPAKAPVNTGKPIQRGDVGVIKQVGEPAKPPASGTITRRSFPPTPAPTPAPKAPPGYIQKVGGGFEKIIPNVNASTGSTNIEKARELAQAGQQPARPSPRMEREAINPATGKQYTPEEKRALNASIDQRVFKRSQTIQPTQAQISTQQYTPTQEDIQLAAQERGTLAATQAGIGTTGRDTTETDREGWWTQYGYGSQAEALQTGQFVIDPQTRQWVLRQDTGTTTNTTNQAMEAAKTRAEQLAAGDMTGVPQIPLPKEVEVGELGVAREIAPMEAITAKEAVAPTIPEAAKVEEVARAAAPKDIKAATIEDLKLIGEEELPEVTTAIGQLSDESIPRIQEAAKLDPTEAARIATEEAEKYLTPELKGTVSGDALVQAIAKREAAVMAPVDEAQFRTRVADIITEKQKQDILQTVTGEGVNLEDIPQFQVIGKRTAQVGEATTRIAQELGDAPSTDAVERAALTSDGVAKGNASQIGGVPTLAAASRQAVTGEARKTAAEDMMAVVGEMPPEITAAIIEDPATVEAQLDTQPVNVQAATAALPQEALVSVQMENLLAGIEAGKTPVWARPAVDAVNQMMAQRGLSASTVGRDALFNAIIQSALPIAQSNATALQQRAAQNLSNEQQANLQQANQVMQQRMANLANRQTAASQTAQMAQEVKLRQAEFEQQAVLTTAQQEQQVRMQNIQNAQQRASQESAQRQQVALSNLDTATRVDLANLEQLNQAGRENLSSEQQVRLTQYQAKIDRNNRQAELNQRMEEVNLDARLKVELANLTEMNATQRLSMSNEQQTRLANLNVLVDFKKSNAQLAQQMDLANMSAENQMELANLQEKAAADSANFTEANRFRLQELTTTAQVLSQNAELRNRAELAKLGAEEKVALANLTAKNQAESENMTAENQAELANLNKKLRVAEVNANLAQQMGLAELTFEQNRAMQNAQTVANMDMANFNAQQQTALANSKFMQTVTLENFNAEQQAIMQDASLKASLNLAELDSRTKLEAQRAQNFLQMDITNLNNQQQSNMLKAQMQQQTMLSNQSAINAAKQFNASSENQTNQFMASLATQIDQFNAAQLNTSNQFNVAQQNARDALKFQVDADLEKANASMVNNINQFNAQMDFERNKFNTANAQAIEQSNLAWRRQVNTANTAAANQVAMQNAQNAFNMSAQAQSFLWQELRDQANYTWQSSENEENRKAQLYAQALANEGGSAKDWSSNVSKVGTLINSLFGGKG
jgi:hypothetical protein